MADFMRVKYENPKLKQSEIANQLSLSSSTLQRYRNDISMLSPYRINPNNTNKRTKKAKNTIFDNNSSRDPDLKVTSNDLKTTSNEPVKNKRNKLKGADPNNDNTTPGSILIEQAFSSNEMGEFIESVKKDVNIQNEISKTIDKYTKESFSTRSQIGQNASIQSKIFKQAINIMGETISDMDVEIEQKDNKIQFLEDKIGIPDSKVIEEMNRLDLNKISCKEKNDRIMNRLNKTLHNHKCIKS